MNIPCDYDRSNLAQWVICAGAVPKAKALRLLLRSLLLMN